MISRNKATFLYSSLIGSVKTYSRKYIVRNVVSEWSEKFEKAEVSEPESSVKNIVAHVLQLRHPGDLSLKMEEDLDESLYSKLLPLFECRLARMPVQYIIKEWDFRDLQLKMSPPVFIPRPETEMLVDIVMDSSKSAEKILEVGCGSGAISIALLKENEQLNIVAVDHSKRACKLTEENAKQHGVLNRLDICLAKLRKEGGFTPADSAKRISSQKYDVIVSNPPYVPSAELLTVEPEIYVYEDLRALDGGKDGLIFIKPLLRSASELLKESGSIFLETHYLHAKLISDWILQNPSLNLQFVQVFKDFSQKDRFVEIRKGS